jgi:hypothetical protein
MTGRGRAAKQATPPEQPDNQLAELLCQLDEFLRSPRPAVTSALLDFMKERGHPHPGFAACNLIDDLSFTAYRYRHPETGQDH